MKNQKQYNRFIQLGNAPVCVYGNVLVRATVNRGKHSTLKKAWNFLKRKASG